MNTRKEMMNLKRMKDTLDTFFLRLKIESNLILKGENSAQKITPNTIQ
jgi:hypothetical protein